MAVIQDIIAARLFRDVRNAVSGKWITASFVFTR